MGRASRVDRQVDRRCERFRWWGDWYAFILVLCFRPILKLCPDAVFRDSHTLLVQHVSGTFAQIDLRHSHRPIDAVPRVALSWNVVDGSEGALAFVADKRGKWEVPYDDV